MSAEERLRAPFDSVTDLTVGLEEEIMVLDPDGLDLLPVAEELLAAAGGHPSVKGELPAAQLELLSAPQATVRAAAGELAASRLRLARLAAGWGRGARFAAAGAHPFAAPEGVLSRRERYAGMRAEYGPVARRQLVFGLHVHVAVRGADRALAVVNALRSFLPELAALAANAPFHAGADTGLASIRPKISETLPRQGVPPAFAGFGEYAGALAWGAAAGAVPEPRLWWWELRLHPVHGTVEVRVPDAQGTVADTAAVGAFAHALVAWLAARHDAGEALPVAPTWRIEENRWSACRHGVHGMLADLVTGEPLPTRRRIVRLLDELGPTAAVLGCAEELQDAHALAVANGADRQRAVAGADPGVAAAWLADRFVAGLADGSSAPAGGG